MSGFSLPNESIPLWAKDLSEDQWKTFLDSRLEPKRAEDKWTEDGNSVSYYLLNYWQIL